MNANELADELNRKLSGRLIGFTAAMLRQQQEKLNKYELRHAEQRKRIDEQQAEIEVLGKKLDTRTKELIGASFYEHDYKTLMAKPPLTDKEIEEVAVINLGHSMGLLNWMGFARAILRKAQEK
jgi:hypothetical protein